LPYLPSQLDGVGGEDDESIASIDLALRGYENSSLLVRQMKALKDQLSDMGDGPSSIYVAPALGKKGGPVASS
jgi:hypothetical protein